MNSWYDLIETNVTGNAVSILFNYGGDSRLFFLSRSSGEGSLTTSCNCVGGNHSWSDGFLPNISTNPHVINFSINNNKWVMNLKISEGIEYFKVWIFY